MFPMITIPVGLDEDGFPRAGNLPFTYESAHIERVFDGSAAAGTNVLYTTLTPAGKIRVITHIAATNSTTVVTNLTIGSFTEQPSHTIRFW